MNLGMGHWPSVVLCVCVCMCVWAVVQRPLGRLGCCPTFLALMSDRDHLTGLKTSVTCLYLAGVTATARAQRCSCFPKCTGQSMIMRKDILIRAVATWGRHAGSHGGGRVGGWEGGLVTITPPGSLTGESLAAYLGGEIKSAQKALIQRITHWTFLNNSLFKIGAVQSKRMLSHHNAHRVFGEHLLQSKLVERAEWRLSSSKATHWPDWSDFSQPLARRANQDKVQLWCISGSYPSSRFLTCKYHSCQHPNHKYDRVFMKTSPAIMSKMAFQAIQVPQATQRLLLNISLMGHSGLFPKSSFGLQGFSASQQLVSERMRENHMVLQPHDQHAKAHYW